MPLTAEDEAIYRRIVGNIGYEGQRDLLAALDAERTSHAATLEIALGLADWLERISGEEPRILGVCARVRALTCTLAEGHEGQHSMHDAPATYTWPQTQDEAIDVARKREVMRDRKARFYERGYQHVAADAGRGY